MIKTSAICTQEKIAALVGHEDESVTFGRYGKGFQPIVMLEVVEALSAEITKKFPTREFAGSR